MGCQGKVFIGDYLTFSVCTHDPDTGERTDAATPPTYDFYAENTAAPILSGSMAKHNSKTGLYFARVQVVSANGFSPRKSYNIDISATVNLVTGGISFGFLTENPSSSSAVKAKYNTITVKNELLQPVADCEVWISSDYGGIVVVDGPRVTNDDGKAAFLLDEGVSYYCWRKKSGVNFANPVVFVAVGD